MNTNFVKSLLVIGMGLSLAACSSNDPEPKKEDTKVVEAKKEEKKEAPVATFGQRLKWCSSGVLIGFILTVIIQFIYKLWQKRNKIYDRLA